MKFIDKFRKFYAQSLSELSVLPITLTRLLLAWGFYTTGKGKLAHIDKIIDYFTTLKIPHPELQAPFVAGLEYYGGTLLLVGLATRPTAALLFCTMVIALLTADHEDLVATLSSSSDKFPVEITSFTYMLLLGWLVVYGSGVLSLDADIAFLCSKMRGKSAEE